MSDPDFTRTRSALAHLDRLHERMDTALDVELAALVELAEQAQRDVGEAFYLDTADRNFPECASFSMCRAGLDFMRACAGNPSGGVEVEPA
jgi:hypothetical protein